jgi:riboflavin kinase/FMN adenylyltransferase
MVQKFLSLDGVYIKNTWLTIGSFDGVHIGHQQLIKELIQHGHSAGAKSVVLTFHPHPSSILGRRKGAFYLTIPTEKVKLLDELGIDIIVIHPFSIQLSQTTAREFIVYLQEHLDFRQLLVGNDFALGKGREGDVNYLKLLGSEFNYRVNIVKSITVENSTVSSSNIRNFIKEGNVEQARILLGRPYQITGEVVHGDGRGKVIGIPTANLEVDLEKLNPGAGVYACKVEIKDKVWNAAVNIGTRPTFMSSDPKKHIEAHILNFSDDLYNEQISLLFFSRLRGEQRFQSIEELIKQVNLDIIKVREIMASDKNSGEIIE